MEDKKKELIKKSTRSKTKSKAGVNANKAKLDIVSLINNVFNKISTDKKLRNGIFIFLIAVFVIAILIGVILNINKSAYAKKYRQYEEKMNTYGFNELYENKSVKSSETINKAEAVTMAIATVLNTKDITWFAEEYNEYPNQTFVEYAIAVGIISKSEITKENYMETPTYEEVVRYFENAKSRFSDKEASSLDYTVLNKPETYSTETQIAFADYVANEVIAVKPENIDGRKKVIKGEVNELVVNSLEKLAFVAIDGSRLRFSDMPSNSDKYPYILFDVPNKVYEYEFDEGTPLLDTMDAKELYLYQSKYYSQIKEYVESYYEAVLNVDFNTINLVTYTDELDNYLVFTSLTTSVVDYYQYVLDNHIKMSADVTLMEPCIYFDGGSYRARIKIELNIESADTRDNLLLYDGFYGDTYTYNESSYVIYADAKLTNALNADNPYLESQVPIGEITLNSDDLNITCTKNNTSSGEVE